MSSEETIKHIEQRVDRLITNLREDVKGRWPKGDDTTPAHLRLAHLEWEVNALRRALAMTLALQVAGMIRSDASSAAIDSAFDDLERRMS